MCRGLPLEGLGVAPGANRTKATAQQAFGATRPAQYDDIFLQYTYKVMPCDKNYRHDYATCPFSHLGESSERRHPSAYLPFMCGSTQHSTDLKEKCPFGTACKYAHGHFELWLHPGRFRTKMCSLGENCKRPVCFFAHSEQELRVTPYSKLDTGAAAAAQQLAQMQQEGSLCPSLEAISKAGSACGSSDASDLKSATNFSSTCGSELALSLQQQGSPCSSVTAVDDLGALTAGFALTNQAAMLGMQLQSNALALAAADASLAVTDAAAAVGSSAAPGLWLAGSNGMLQHQMPLAGCTTGLNTMALLQQQQQLAMLDANNQLIAYNPITLQPAMQAVASDFWGLPSTTAAPVANNLAQQWAANNLLAQQRQAAFNGLTTGLAGCNTSATQCLGAPRMVNTAGLDQWLQMDTYAAPRGVSRAALGCSMAQQQQPSANARVAQLLSALPDQTVQQLLGMLAIEPQA
eukprot:GHUV01000430.1.p1 GENE.GHUV01000430.1~~GHUV01000430.1.p1  ORF type:complete len:463 (+),score=169.54 GHUV01000430.1:217-1605(+)